ncbi:phage baseplate plug family protein [Serratia proteamaculans]
MQITEIPLSPDNQQFNTQIGSGNYRIRVIWRDATGWVIDLQDSSGADIIAGIPLVTDVDLLTQYEYLGLGFALICMCDAAGQEYPTKADLGSGSHLYVVTE